MNPKLDGGKGHYWVHWQKSETNSRLDKKYYMENKFTEVDTCNVVSLRDSLTP